MLFEAGEKGFDFFVVLEGRVEILAPSGETTISVTVHEAGEFTGDVDMVGGRSAIVTAVVTEAGRPGPTPPGTPVEQSPRRISMPPECTHVDRIQPVEPGTNGCEACLQMGSDWVHLRVCLLCGYVGCCDSSPHRHATKHYEGTGHPLVQSYEPGENWVWCYVDEAVVPADVPPRAHQ